MSSRPLVSSAPARPVASPRPASFPQFPVYAFWFLMTFELDQFMSATIGGPFYRLPLLLTPLLIVGLLLRGDKRALYWPLIVLVLHHLGASIFAENAGLSRDAFKFMVYMLVLFAVSVCFLDTPTKIIVVLKMYLLHFIWYGVQGIPGGRITWHSLLSNEDSYGPLMVLALPIAYFFGQATSSRGWRWVARATFFVALLGIVVSFARGAAISAALVLLYILFRSPRRVATLLVLLLVAMVLVPVAGLFVPLDEYIAEIQSSSEGDEGRMDVWQMAWDVFRHSPVYGVGAFNFGVVASRIIPPDPTRAKGADPAQIYTLWTHNAGMQILAEEGLIGVVVFGAMLIGFFRRNARLRRTETRAAWDARGGGAMDLRRVSFGLDGAMIGWVGCSIFYNQLYIHWFWSLLAISYVLAVVTSGTPATGDEKRKT